MDMFMRERDWIAMPASGRKLTPSGSLQPNPEIGLLARPERFEPSYLKGTVTGPGSRR